MDWLTRFLFTHTRQTVPDGRPLYAYKMSDAQYADFRTHFHQIILLDPQGTMGNRGAMHRRSLSSGARRANRTG